MTETRVPAQKKPDVQSKADMEAVPVTSVSEIPISRSSVKWECVGNTAKVTRTRLESSMADSSQLLNNTFIFSGK